SSAGLFHGALPSQLHLLRADQRPNLRLPFRLALRANCYQLGKELGRSDELISVAAAILPFRPTVSVKALEFDPAAAITDLLQGQTPRPKFSQADLTFPRRLWVSFRARKARHSIPARSSCRVPAGCNSWPLIYRHLTGRPNAI